MAVEETLLNGNKILQDPQKFMFGIDAVLLADFAAKGIRRKDKVMDLCTGTAIVPLLLDTISTASSITALEIQPESARMASESVALNNLESKIEVVEGDLKKVDELFPKHSFTVVTCNPPYMSANTGKQNPGEEKAIARHEILCNLEDVIKASDYLIKPDGSLYLIHRPNRLAEIFYYCRKYNLEPKVMQMVIPFENKEPTMVLIEARKNARPDLKVLHSLIVYESAGKYSKEVEEIYARQKLVLE